MLQIGKRLLHNLPLKIGALFFAALLWFHTVTDKTYEYNFEVVNSSVKLPSGYRLEDSEIPTIMVKLNGKGKGLLECFDKKSLTLDVDLTGYHAGSFEYPVDASRIILPKSGNILVAEVIFPKFIRLKLVKNT